jgi:hypothetical protein
MKIDIFLSLLACVGTFSSFLFPLPLHGNGRSVFLLLIYVWNFYSCVFIRVRFCQLFYSIRESFWHFCTMLAKMTSSNLMFVTLYISHSLLWVFSLIISLYLSSSIVTLHYIISPLSEACLFSKPIGIPFILFFIVFMLIHMCIHCLGQLSPWRPPASLPPPSPLSLPGGICSALLFCNFIEEKT